MNTEQTYNKQTMKENKEELLTIGRGTNLGVVLGFLALIGFLGLASGCKTTKRNVEYLEKSEIKRVSSTKDTTSLAALRLINTNVAIKVVEYSAPNKEGQQYIVREIYANAIKVDSTSTIFETSSISADSIAAEQSSTYKEKTQQKQNKGHLWAFYTILSLIMLVMSLSLIAKIKNTSILGIIKKLF